MYDAYNSVVAKTQFLLIYRVELPQFQSVDVLLGIEHPHFENSKVLKFYAECLGLHISIFMEPWPGSDGC